MPNYDKFRIPIEAPLPCYGMELNQADPECQACPHQDGCREKMGSRLTRTDLSKVVWDLVPEKLFTVNPTNLDDPEIPSIEGAFKECFQLVFERRPRRHNSASQYSRQIINAAKELNFSIRLFMLANMVGWRRINDVHQEENAEVDSINTEFHAKLLSYKSASKRAESYADYCRQKFGVFSVQTLNLVDTSRKIVKNSIEERMLHSEIEAGRYIVSYKLNNGGPPFEDLFSDKELSLDPYWLAIEKRYYEAVLEKHTRKPYGTRAQNFHRHDVNQVLTFLKKYIAEARLAFLIRQHIMPMAVERVLHYFGYGLKDFTAPMEPVKDPLMFWNRLGRAISYYNCWLFVTGEPDSIYRP